jgi:hypothetical protein
MKRLVRCLEQETTLTCWLLESDTYLLDWVTELILHTDAEHAPARKLRAELLRAQSRASG